MKSQFAQVVQWYQVACENLTLKCGRGHCIHWLCSECNMQRIQVPLMFKRLQFFLKVYFAIMTNKSQSLWLKQQKLAEIQFREDYFSHDPFYIACLIINASSNLVALAPEGRTSKMWYIKSYYKYKLKK